jgi:hypothetical protein
MIRSFLDASSGHLSADTWSWLEVNLADDVISNPANDAATALAGGKTRYGWFIYAPEDAVEGLPEDLMAVQRRAREQGAEYVLFDCDAAPIPGLPILHPDFRD